MENLRKLIKNKLIESLILKRLPGEGKVVVVSDLQDEREASKETFKNKESLKKANFKWDSNINAWATDERNFVQAQSALNVINKKEIIINKLEDIEELVRNSDAPNKNNLSDRIKLFIDDLANATDEAAADAKLKQYLNFFSKFRKHSFINSFLIFIQNPNATKVAGFRQWEEKFHRRVIKGAKGIMIYAPMVSKKKGEEDLGGDEDEKTITRFKPVFVFDVADTEPIDEKGNLPEEPQWFDNNTPNETADQLTRYTEVVLEELGINLTKTDAKGGEKGYSAGDHINLTSSIEGVGRLSTLIHELAHELMHWKRTSPFYDEENLKNNNSRELKELQAESVSYTVLRHYEIPVQHHATYLALWKANKDKIKDNMNLIVKVAKFIIEKIDNVAEHLNKVETQNLQEFFFENIDLIEDTEKWIFNSE